MSVASNLERQMLTLINAERAKHGLQPVKLELRLNDAAEDHSAWMLNVDQFSHTGANGSSPTQRIQDAGFVLSGSWRTAENIAWQSVRGAPGLSDDVQNLHDSLMNSPGHRANILNPDVTVIGIGIETGKYLHNGTNYDAIMVTQNFAKTSAPLQLDNGGSGSGGSGGGSNQPAPTFVSPDKVGDAGDNWFVLKHGTAGRLDGGGGDDQLVGRNGKDTLFGRSGDDVLDGSGGNDVLMAGKGRDTLIGGNGNDKLHGHGGNDIVRGGSGNDVVNGNNGNDALYGNDGKDILNGGNGQDALTGGSGDDDFVFSAGADTVTDFGSGDQISLRFSHAITSYSDLVNNHIYRSGNDVVIDDGLGNTLTLENTAMSDLDRGDFIF